MAVFCIGKFMSVTARQELRTQLKLALPIFGGQLAQSANGFVDTVMAGRVSALDLAAVAVGASIWVPVFLFMTGMLMSATSVLARHVGANQLERINPLVHQVLAVALTIGLLSVLVLCNTEPLLRWMDVDPAIRPMVVDYLFGLSWGMPAIAIVLGLRSYTEAMSHSHRDVDYGDIDGDICASASGLSQCAVNIPSLALGA